MYPLHKLMLEDRIDPKDPALRHVIVGSVLNRFGCRVLVRIESMVLMSSSPGGSAFPDASVLIEPMHLR